LCWQPPEGLACPFFRRLDEGFPVTAFAHQADQRSERLKAKGADIVVGSLTDINDMRTAMAGARCAYFSPIISTSQEN